MSLSPEARREVYRKNAARSTGPKTEAGKARSRRNGLKHGLRAEVLALPNEDPALLALRNAAWNEYYAPQSPGAQHLVNLCVRASVLSDRVARYHDECVATQVNSAVRNWDDSRQDHVLGLFAGMRDDPETALKLLLRSTRGCVGLSHRWERLQRAFEKDGCWFESDVVDVLNLLGSKRDVESLKQNPRAYTLALFNLVAQPGPSSEAIAALCDPANMPDSLRSTYSKDSLPDPESCRDQIRWLIAKEIEAIQARLDSESTAKEVAEREGAENRALILQDETAARLFLRYNSESRNAFLRAFSKLEATLKSDAEAGQESRGLWTECQWRSDLMTDAEPSPLAPKTPDQVAATKPRNSEPDPAAVDDFFRHVFDFEKSREFPEPVVAQKSPSEPVSQGPKPAERTVGGIINAVVAACLLLMFGLSASPAKADVPPSEAVSVAFSGRNSFSKSGFRQNFDRRTVTRRLDHERVGQNGRSR